MYFRNVFVKQNLRLVLLLTTYCCLVVGMGEDLSAKEFDFQFQRIVERDEPIELNLTYLEGNVEIVTSDDGRLVIDAIKRVKAVSLDEAEEVQGYIEIKVTQEKDRVLVQTNYLKMRNHGQTFWQKLFGRGEDESFGEVDWRIAVPEYSTVSITNTSGDITIDHLRAYSSIFQHSLYSACYADLYRPGRYICPPVSVYSSNPAFVHEIPDPGNRTRPGWSFRDQKRNAHSV